MDSDSSRACVAGGLRERDGATEGPPPATPSFPPPVLCSALVPFQRSGSSPRNAPRPSPLSPARMTGTTGLVRRWEGLRQPLCTVICSIAARRPAVAQGKARQGKAGGHVVGRIRLASSKS